MGGRAGLFLSQSSRRAGGFGSRFNQDGNTRVHSMARRKDAGRKQTRGKGEARERNVCECAQLTLMTVDHMAQFSQQYLGREQYCAGQRVCVCVCVCV
jgi:hypothetical protein